MNMIEISKLRECRKKLDSIRPTCPEELSELERVKDILDDILEFKEFPDISDYENKNNRGGPSW